MKHTMKKWGSLFCALALTAALLTGCGGAAPEKEAVAGIPPAPRNSYVLDESDILSEETESFVNQRTQALTESTGAQIAVLTVDFTGSLTTEEFALTVGNNWGVGDEDKDNGVILLLVPGADDYWCMQGEGLDTLLPTSTLSRILQQEMEPNWVAGDFDAGVRQTVQALFEELCSVYGVSPRTDVSYSGYDTGFRSDSSAYTYSYGYPYHSQESRGSLAPMLFVVIVVLVILFLVLPSGPRGGGGGSIWPWLFLFNNNHRRGPRPPRPPRSGGSFGGGSFGGGSFRGGGAGRGR